MGDRRQIHFNFGEEGKIVFYSHWGGYFMTENFARALQKAKPRWGDDPYFVRIILSQFLKEDIDGETGYGIAPYDMDTEYEDFHIDLKNKTVNGKSYQKFIDYHIG